MRARIVLLAAASAVAALGPARASVACPAAYAPFEGFPGAQLVRTEYLSEDGVAYAMYRGLAPSFDGLPMSVDVTVPCDAAGPMPLVTMAHGWTDDKTIWEETGRSDTVSSEFRRGSNHHWNNIWFAARGYAVLNYTARGWHDSCGPRAAGSIPGVAPGPQCIGKRYWIHMSDQRWEVRDTAWLTAGLVESGVADAGRLAITGGSYGGGTTIMNAILRNRIVCGAPGALSPDPCAGKTDGDHAPWTTRDGVALAWRAAVPQYTWGDVIQVLVPNGRGTDGVMLPHGSTTSPVGIPISSYLAGLYVAGQPLGNGYFQPPGIDERSDITVQTLRTLAGNPFLPEDPIVARGVEQFHRFKSAIGIPPNGAVPIFWTHGFTDPLFTALEPLQIANVLRAYDPDYPITLFFGDLGHDYAAERVDEWDAAHEQMNAFLDHHMLGAGAPPPVGVTAAVTRCLNPADPMELVSGPTWASLAPSRLVLSGERLTGVSSSTVVGDEGRATDPVTTATDPIPGAYKKCRTMRPAVTDANTLAWEFPVSEPVTLMGGPVVDLTYSFVGAPQLNVRLWDVTPGGTAQALVTRGTYRTVLEPGETDARALFQIAPTGYRFAAGHTIKLEVTANDFPYRAQDNTQSLLIDPALELTLPTR